jgi:hypothetical protein
VRGLFAWIAFRDASQASIMPRGGMRHPTCVASSLVSSAVLALVVLMPPYSQAHHSSAMYDDKQTVTVEGTVSKFEWSNPHVYIYLKQMSGGQTFDWEIEASPPSILGRLGWTRDTLHVGDAITVVGRPARDAGKRSLLPNEIRRGDTMLFDRKGELVRLANADTTSSHSTTDAGLNGIWVTLLALKVAEQLDPEKLSLTAAGTAALKGFDEKKMHPGANCIPNPAPVFMITPDLKRISQGDGAIFIDGEFDGAQRTIHMNVSTHDGAAASIQGHSIGRWEGNSLVIDTTKFAYYALGNGYGLPSGLKKHLVERLTPGADSASLTYHFEMTDPEFLAAPVQGDVQWVFRPNLKYAPLKCDPDNAKRFTGHSVEKQL